MKPSDLFFKLMSAAQERGIEHCKQDFRRGGNRTKPDAVCAVGLLFWGEEIGIITERERMNLRGYMPADTLHLNDAEGWTFPNFYSYLQAKEEKKERERKDAPTNLEVSSRRHLAPRPVDA